MSNCHRMKSLLSAYIDREMTGEEAYLMREHISLCESCALEYEELRRVKQILAELPEVEPSDDFLDNTKTAVFANEKQKSISKRGLLIGTSMAAATLFLTFALMQWVDVQQNKANSPIPADDVVASDVRTFEEAPSGAAGYLPVNFASAPE